jgi:hypothetical protein
MARQTLLTATIAKKIPALYSQDGNADALVVAKFFSPSSNWTWYVTEGEEQGTTDDGRRDWMFFGLVIGHDNELGYFRLSDLESVRGPFGLGIERDIHWTPTSLAKVQNGEVR